MKEVRKLWVICRLNLGVMVNDKGTKQFLFRAEAIFAQNNNVFVVYDFNLYHIISIFFLSSQTVVILMKWWYTKRFCIVWCKRFTNKKKEILMAPQSYFKSVWLMEAECYALL